MAENNLAVLDYPECRAGLAQLAQMDLAFHCEDHGVIRIDMQVIGRELAVALRENAQLRTENETLRAELQGMEGERG